MVGGCSSPTAAVLASHHNMAISVRVRTSGEDGGGLVFQGQPLEASQRQQRAVALALLQLAQPRLHVAAEVDHLCGDVGQMQQGLGNWAASDGSLCHRALCLARLLASNPGLTGCRPWIQAPITSKHSSG